MNKTNHFKRRALIASVLLAAPLVSHSAIVPDRTRVIFNGNENSITVTLKNGNATLPYLAQAWLEDDKFAKDTRYFTALPPLQRIEPKSDGRLKSSRYQPRLAYRRTGKVCFISTCGKFRRKAISLIRSSWRCKRVLSFSTAR